jgi:hypothetical protein
MAKKDDKKGNAAGAGAASVGAKSSAGPKLPVTSSGQGGDQKRVSPAAIASMVGKSLKDLNGGKKRMPNIPGLPRLGGTGRTSNGEKPKLLAIFFVVYAQWTNFGRFIPNGMTKNVFVDGMEATKENRVMYVVSPAGTVVAQEAFHAIPAWLKANLEGFVAALNEKGTWTLPAGYALVPQFDTDEKASTKISSFRKNAELSEYFAKLATETVDEALKAEYTEKATYYGEAQKYDGWCCATAENAQKVADVVRSFHALNPEVRNDFMELESWSPVYGQNDLAAIPNAYWPETAEYAAELEAEKAEEAAAQA